MGQLRHLRGARRHRRHVGPVPLPGHPLRLRHVHARLLVPPVGRREVDRRRRVDPAVHQGHRGRRGHRRAHPLPPPHRRAPTGRPTTRVWHVTAERTDTGETVELTCRLRLLVQRLLPLRPRLPARLRRHGPLRRHDRPPAGLARGPRLRRQAGRRDRQRRHRGHAHPVDGRDRGARHDAPAVAHLHHVAARQGPDRQRCCGAILPDARVRPGDPLVQGAHHAGVLPAQPAPARSSSRRLLRKGVERQLPDGLRRRHPLHAHATTRGTSACASCPTATCSRRSRPGDASVVTDHDRPLHRDRHRCSSPATELDGRHRRHRHRASSCCSSAASSCRVDGEPRRHRRASSPTRG